MKGFLCALALGAVMTTGCAQAEITGPVKIGILNDQSGLMSVLHGPGSVVAAKMAVEDFGGSVNGHPIEIVVADHQNRPDVASEIARRWIDVDGVDAIFDVPNSAVAIAVVDVVKEKNSVLIDTGAGTNRLTGDKCSANSIHWNQDNWAQINGTVKTLVEKGMKSWFFLTVDAETGYDMERQARPMLQAGGAKEVGSIKYPLGSSDFSSFLLQAQASKAQAIAIAGGGNDVDTIIKQGAEFAIQAGGQTFATLAAYEVNMRGAGLDLAQGTVLTDSFYWDQTDATRAFSKRFAERFNGRKPTAHQAGVYSAILHYLKAATKANEVKDGALIIKTMKEIPTDDPLFGKNYIRKDGREIQPMYVYQTKSPSESRYDWDDLKLIATIPAESAFKPLDPACPLSVAQ
jgi:branched-chain amino acid transport system substrate-binding protein